MFLRKTLRNETFFSELFLLDTNVCANFDLMNLESGVIIKLSMYRFFDISSSRFSAWICSLRLTAEKALVLNAPLCAARYFACCLAVVSGIGKHLRLFLFNRDMLHGFCYWL